MAAPMLGRVQGFLRACSNGASQHDDKDNGNSYEGLLHLTKPRSRAERNQQRREEDRSKRGDYDDKVLKAAEVLARSMGGNFESNLRDLMERLPNGRPKETELNLHEQTSPEDGIRTHDEDRSYVFPSPSGDALNHRRRKLSEDTDDLSRSEFLRQIEKYNSLVPPVKEDSTGPGMQRDDNSKKTRRGSPENKKKELPSWKGRKETDEMRERGRQSDETEMRLRRRAPQSDETEQISLRNNKTDSESHAGDVQYGMQMKRQQRKKKPHWEEQEIENLSLANEDETNQLKHLLMQRRLEARRARTQAMAQAGVSEKPGNGAKGADDEMTPPPSALEQETAERRQELQGHRLDMYRRRIGRSWQKNRVFMEHSDHLPVEDQDVPLTEDERKRATVVDKILNVPSDFKLYDGAALGVFTDNAGNRIPGVRSAVAPLDQSAFDKFERKKFEQALRLPPANAFEEMARWTKEGKMPSFPINNEEGMHTEDKTEFHEHIFLDHLLEDFPRTGPIRVFMELVILGLSKNHHMSVAVKHRHIEAFRKYFKEREEVVEESLRNLEESDDEETVTEVEQAVAEQRS